MTTYITYTRVSTKRQGESGLGLQSQQAILDHYFGHKEVIASFTEVGSAKDIDGRPELQKAIALCLTGGHTLAIAKLDRLSRRTEDALDIWGKLDGKLHSCDIPQDNGRMDKFTLTIFMALADRERELNSIRTRAALKVAKEKGVKLGKHPNQKAHYFGDGQRQRGQATMRLKAINGYRPKLEYIQMLRRSGLSLRAIATRLNETGNKTRTGGTFYGTTVQRILDRAELT